MTTRTGSNRDVGGVADLLRRVAVRGRTGVALLAGLAAPLHAQRARTEAAPPNAVHLRLHPRVGDTVHTRFEQTVQLVPRGDDGVERPAVASRMTVLGHSIVESLGAAGAVIVAVTDSVALRATGASAGAAESARRAMQGRRSRVRVAPDGATTVLGGTAPADPKGAAGPPPVRFPAALPPGPVAPGAMWARAITVPWGGGRGARGTPAAGSTVDVWFHLDSLARGGAMAYLSLRGTVRPPGAAPAAAGGGSRVDGAIVVDLARGWVVDSRTTFQLDGSIAAPGGAPRPGRVVVTQRLRVL